MTSKRPQRGFTIVETLVAITILMIAIAGPLSVASKGLTAALASRDQMIASYLAQESMETVKNIRDNNQPPSPSWLSGLTSCTSSAPCDASAIDSTKVTSGEALLLLTASGNYSHGASGTNSIFRRKFYLTRISDNEYTVTVSVTWNHGTVPYSISATSGLINTDR